MTILETLVQLRDDLKTWVTNNLNALNSKIEEKTIPIDDKLNSLMMNVILLLRDSMSVRSKFNLENLNRMLIWRTPDISRRLKITPSILDRLHKYHDDLDTILYRNGQSDVLSAQQNQILSSLAFARVSILYSPLFIPSVKGQ